MFTLCYLYLICNDREQGNQSKRILFPRKLWINRLRLNAGSFVPICAVQKTGNTCRIPPLFERLAVPNPPGIRSCRWNQRFPKETKRQTGNGKGCDCMKIANTILNTIIGAFIGVFIGHGIYVVWNFKTRPELYAMQSAPWYTSILVYGLFTLVVLFVCIVIKVIIKRKAKKIDNK